MQLCLCCMALMGSLSGCGGTNLASIPLTSALTQKELSDYYTQSLNYKMDVEHSTGFDKVEYEFNDVSDDVATALTEATQRIESNLAAPVWNNNMYVTEDMHQYVKALIDDKVLTRTDAPMEVKESQGHYFVTVTYAVSPQATGSMTDNIRHLGIHGALSEDAYGYVKVSASFSQLVDQVLQVYNTGIGQPNGLLTQKMIDNILIERANNIEKDVSGNENNSVQLTDINANLRTPRVDIELVNKLLGASVRQTAVMPALTTVYQPVGSSGTMSGYGIFPEGGFTMKNFGYDRSNMNGTMQLRYVFKKGLVDSSVLEFKNVYIVGYELDESQINKEPSVTPEFLQTNIEVALDRADRCLSNNDLAGLMNAKVFGDCGVAVLSGFTNQHSYLQQISTKLTQVIGRDSNESNNYLISMITSKKLGAKGGEDYACYKLSGYAVVSQVGNDFVITDYVYTKCELTREPQINVDDTIMKRLASLVNSGAIPESDKQGIIELMNTLYTAGNERNLTDIRNCFNSDTALLPSTRKEYLVSQLCGWLVARGVDVPSTHTGFVCEWIGGTDEQAEFMTQELIDYSGLDTGMYIKNYYMVSRYGDNWVIDESKVVETKEVYGDELASIRESIQSNQVFNVSDTVLSDDAMGIVNDIEEEQAVESETSISEAGESTENGSTTEESATAESTEG